MHRSLLGLAALLLAGCANGTDSTIVRSAKPYPGPVPTSQTEIPDFFMAFSWYGHAYTSPIATQPYDMSQCPKNPNAPCLSNIAYRIQWNAIQDRTPVIDWVKDPRNRGHLFILGDAVHDSNGAGGLYVTRPDSFAADYCTFVRQVQAVDSTAEFTPGLIEDFAKESWLNDLANALVARQKRGECGTHPVAEWEFNFYPRWSLGVAGFEDYVDRKAAWSMSWPAPIGAPLVLAAWTVSFGVDDVPNDDPRYLDRLRVLKAWLFAHDHLRLARYLDYEAYPTDKPDPHPLADVLGNLTATGRVYAEVTGRISGPTAIRPKTTCRWLAETTGGPRPYAFTWTVDSASLAASFWLDHAADSSFVIQMTVTDVAGGHSTAQMEVAVRPDAPIC